MKDVTDRFNSYRECVRHLWNTHFLGVTRESPDPWDRRDEFDDVCSILFGSLVLAPLGVIVEGGPTKVLSRGCDANAPALSWLHVVVPQEAAGTPIWTNRDPTRDSGYWDHDLRWVAPSDVSLRFVRWFDFDELAFRDFRYFLVRIVSGASADVVGRAALVECDNVHVLLDERASPAKGSL